MTITVGADVRTAYDYFARQLPLNDGRVQLKPTIVLGEKVAIVVGDDDGNGKKKIVLGINPDGQAEDERGKVVSLEIPACYLKAPDVQMGRDCTRYQVNDETSDRGFGPEFWMGEDAVKNDGDALPIGSTAARLEQDAHRDFGVACIVEALRTAGYPAGAYNIALARAIPNTEVSAKKKTGADNITKAQVRINATTREALKKHLQNKRFTVNRIDPLGHEDVWTLDYIHIMPLPQSIGTFIALTRDLQAHNQFEDVEAVKIIDMGGGDEQLIDVMLDDNNIVVTGERIGNGTIDIARALAREFPELHLNDAQAQRALEKRSLRNRAGRRERIDDVIGRVVNTEGQTMIRRKLATLTGSGYFLVFTGGGIRIPEIHDLIEQQVHIAGKREGYDYMFIDDRVSGTLNAFGVWLMLIFAGNGRGV